MEIFAYHSHDIFAEEDGLMKTKVGNGFPMDDTGDADTDSIQAFNSSKNPILILQMGGTIDKDYPKRRGGYAFEISAPATQSMMGKVQPALDVEFQTVCQKDSQDITDEDRHHLYEVCKSATHTSILITHGTDTMIETASYLANKKLQKTIIFTGSFLPATFKNSDADFNIGVALGALQCLSLYNVFVAMNGCVRLWNRVTRSEETGQFVAKL